MIVMTRVHLRGKTRCAKNGAGAKQKNNLGQKQDKGRTKNQGSKHGNYGRGSRTQNPISKIFLRKKGGGERAFAL